MCVEYESNMYSLDPFFFVLIKQLGPGKGVC